MPITCIAMPSHARPHGRSRPTRSATAPAQSGSWSRPETEPSDSDDWETKPARYAANKAAREAYCAQLQAAGLPFFPDGTDNMNEVLLSTAAARQTVWLHHCDHFVLGTVGSDTTHLRRDWCKEELAGA